MLESRSVYIVVVKSCVFSLVKYFFPCKFETLPERDIMNGRSDPLTLLQTTPPTHTHTHYHQNAFTFYAFIKVPIG